MTDPREIIGQWLAAIYEENNPEHWADALLQALDEQGMAVVPKEYQQLMMRAAESVGKTNITMEMRRAKRK